MTESKKEKENPLLVATKFVQRAIEEQKRNPANFNFLVDQFSSKHDQVTHERWLTSLGLCTQSLTKNSEPLVNAALKVNWPFGSTRLFEAFSDFLENLLSTNAFFLILSINHITSHFTFKEDQSQASHKVAFDRIHSTLFRISKIIPTSASILFRSLSDNFPHKRQAVEIQEWYVQHTLKVLDYYPELLPEIFPLLFDRLLQVDVEIQSEVQEIKEMTNQNDMMFDIEEDLRPVESQPVAILTKKLDAMMTLVFDYLERYFQETDPASQNFMLELILINFEKYVMQTHQSRYVQYFVFYLLSKRREFPDIFLSFLVQILGEQNKSPIVRQSAAGYIAGFIARSNFVDMKTSARCLELMIQWLHSFIDHCEKDVGDLDPEKYALFYFVCQAVFYIFCFRNQALLNIEGNRDFIRKLRFDRIIACQFNPLRICSKSVVQEFARLTQKYEIAYCYVHLERNKRLVPSGKGSQAIEALQKELDSFFVFEPFEMEHSGKFIRNLYQVWDDTEEEDETSTSPSISNRLSSGRRSVEYDEDTDVFDRKSKKGRMAAGLEDEEETHKELADMVFSHESYEVEKTLLSRFATSFNSASFNSSFDD